MKSSPLNLQIKCTESSMKRNKTTRDSTEQFLLGSPPVQGCVAYVVSFLDTQGGGMYDPIRIKSVIALNINSKDAVGVGEGYRMGAWEPPLALPVFQVCLSARCLTLNGAGDECNLWQPMDSADSWES